MKFLLAIFLLAITSSARSQLKHEYLERETLYRETPVLRTSDAVYREHFDREDIAKVEPIVGISETDTEIVVTYETSWGLFKVRFLQEDLENPIDHYFTNKSKTRRFSSFYELTGIHGLAREALKESAKTKTGSITDLLQPNGANKTRHSSPDRAESK